MTRAKYTQRYDNELFEVPLKTKYRLACCDCGLTHDVVFIIKCNKLFMSAKRNNKSTEQRRRYEIGRQANR